MEYRKDEGYERYRRFEVYIRKNKLSSNILLRMNQSDIDRIYAHLDAHPEKYPIPVSEESYLYHGTSQARLAQIVKQGLIPSNKSRYSKVFGIGDWSVGKVFVADTVELALTYAKTASKSKPALLRVLTSSLPDRMEDIKDESGSYYVTRDIESCDLEVWKSSGWAPLQEPVLTPTIKM